MFDFFEQIQEKRKKKRGYKTRRDLEQMTRDEIYALAEKKGFHVKRDKKKNMITEFLLKQ